MKIKELLKILDEQKLNLIGLVKIVKNKQNVLVNNKLEKLSEYMSLEEKKLLEIQIVEEKRLSVMQQLFSQYNIESERFKLEILITALTNKIPQNFLDSIKQNEREMKNLIQEITRINQQNLLLVQQSSQIITETVKAVIDTSKRSFIDRKG